MREPSCHRIPAPRRGFTLIELLIVVAITALLVAVLLPSLAGARAFARRTLCQKQLGQWGLAFQMYADENAGVWPHTDGLDRDKGPADRCGWVDVLPRLLGDKPWRDYPTGQRPGAGTFFQCPAARLAPQSLYGYQPQRVGYFSYAMNSCLELDEDCWRAPGDGGVAMPSFLRIDDIVRPADVILLFDQLLDPRRGYGGGAMNRSAGKYCGSYPKAFSARHAREGETLGGSILYSDYHVEWLATLWKPHWPDGLEVPPRDDPNWFPYPPEG